jgi:hypothetical protein
MIIFFFKEHNKNTLGIDSSEKFTDSANELQNKK